MKLERKQFLSQLERLKPALVSGGDIKAFEHIWFDGAFDGTGKMRACNLNLGIEVPFQSEFQFGVLGKILLGLIASTTRDEVVLEAKQSLSVRMTGSTSNLPITDPAQAVWDFPNVPQHEKSDAAFPHIILTEELVRALERVSLLKCTQRSHAEHYGVTLYTDQATTLMTTNDRAMAQMVVDLKLPKIADKLVLPQEFVTQIVEQCVFGSKLYILDNCLCAVSDDVRIYSKLLDNSAVRDMPAIVARYVTEDETQRLRVPKGMGEALERAKLLGSGDKRPPSLHIAVHKGLLSLKGDYDHGKVDELVEMEAKVDCDDEMAVHLSELLTGMDEADEFSIAEGGRAIALYGEGGFTFVIASAK